ncbi:hypothetical protein CDD83_9668 [Cordyceps sp. RAO-2017]|nr:hypothetical protein CDD83_9668 [Cordyceps sp. RAO-2017]
MLCLPGTCQQSPANDPASECIVRPAPACSSLLHTVRAYEYCADGTTASETEGRPHASPNTVQRCLLGPHRPRYREAGRCMATAVLCTLPRPGTPAPDSAATIPIHPPRSHPICRFLLRPGLPVRSGAGGERSTSDETTRAFQDPKLNLSPALSSRVVVLLPSGTETARPGATRQASSWQTGPAAIVRVEASPPCAFSGRLDSVCQPAGACQSVDLASMTAECQLGRIPSLASGLSPSSDFERHTNAAGHDEEQVLCQSVRHRSRAVFQAPVSPASTLPEPREISNRDQRIFVADFAALWRGAWPSVLESERGDMDSVQQQKCPSPALHGSSATTTTFEPPSVIHPGHPQRSGSRITRCSPMQSLTVAGSRPPEHEGCTNPTSCRATMRLARMTTEKGHLLGSTIGHLGAGRRGWETRHSFHRLRTYKAGGTK